MEKRRVSIVGGGMAGLSAAYVLQKSGKVQVQLFESLSYLGGRTQSRIVRGHAIDFGGFLIYPWYKHSHQLFRELGLETSLKKTPLSDVYYVLRPGAQPIKEHAVPFSKKESLAIWGKSLFKILPKTDLARPDLERFEGETISAYLRKTLKTTGHAGMYETFFDTVNQGYCYGPVEQTKAALMAPIVRQVKLRGDIRTTTFFPNGISAVTDALADSVLAHGGNIERNTPVTAVNGLTINAGGTRVQSDIILFAQTVTPELYRQILPEGEPSCWYTHFLTLAIELTYMPTVQETTDWGALFYTPSPKSTYETLSAINLSSLYGKALESCIMLNVIIRTHTPTLSSKERSVIAEKECLRLFPDGGTSRVLDSVHWKKAMPVADESFIATIRAKHGKNGYYFAGDCLGAPSIETAITTGISAAKDIIKGLG